MSQMSQMSEVYFKCAVYVLNKGIEKKFIITISIPKNRANYHYYWTLNNNWTFEQRTSNESNFKRKLNWIEWLTFESSAETEKVCVRENEFKKKAQNRVILRCVRVFIDHGTKTNEKLPPCNRLAIVLPHNAICFGRRTEPNCVWFSKRRQQQKHNNNIIQTQQRKHFLKKTKKKIKFARRLCYTYIY